MHEQNSNLHRPLNLQVGSGTGEKPAGAGASIAGPSGEMGRCRLSLSLRPGMRARVPGDVLFSSRFAFDGDVV